MDKSAIIIKNIQESIRLKSLIVSDGSMIETINLIANRIITTFKSDGKVLFCGNGGSAADAQHLAAEFSGKYYLNRPPLNAEALNINIASLTAISNDYSYDEIYSRLIRGTGRQGDILIGLSTSGHSTNVINALKTAKSLGCITIGFTGAGGGAMKAWCDLLIEIPSKDTPRIQECHMLIGHSICEIVERELFQK
ncbi:MAG: D-sedoheptulose 7-phosphate isomerase [Bacteroidota bacterium]